MKEQVLYTDFELVSGLEIHVQLNTAAKIFCADSAAFGAGPNEHVSTVSLALPGALPKLNKGVIEKAVRIGLALNCTINQHNTFDRKNYFYADLPKGYQITQDNQPICINGKIALVLADGTERTIRVNRIHLEEDAGKSLHDQHDRFSLVDLNRAGVPLIEIVTEPDIRNAEEASALLTEIRKLVRHLDVSDGNMEEGSLRCDANISIRKPGEDFGTRCEVKNLNSARNLRRAIDFEFQRQAKIVASGGSIVQSTLNFNADTGVTSPMRTKEEANDYRYFPDPDLQPVWISNEWLKAIKDSMPLLPRQLAEELAARAGISVNEAALITGDADILNYFERLAVFAKNLKSAVNWLSGPVRAILNERETGISGLAVSPERLAAVINMVDERRITQQNALLHLIPALEGSQSATAETLAEQLNLIISDNQEELGTFIAAVLARYAPQVEAYKKGKKGILGLFVGEVMKMSKGKADPQKINELLLEYLKK